MKNTNEPEKEGNEEVEGAGDRGEKLKQKQKVKLKPKRKQMKKTQEPDNKEEKKENEREKNKWCPLLHFLLLILLKIEKCFL